MSCLQQLKIDEETGKEEFWQREHAEEFLAEGTEEGEFFFREDTRII